MPHLLTANRRLFLLAGLLAGGCGSKSTTTTTTTVVENQALSAKAVASTDLLAYLPADADIVGSIDVAGVKASGLWAKYSSGLMKAAQEFQRECGFDPIAQATRASFGLHTASGGTPVGTFVVRGIDRDRTLACAAKPHAGTHFTVERGVISTEDGGKYWTIAFPDATTAVLHGGSTTPVTRAKLDAILAGGAPLRSSAAFTALFATADQTASLWVVVNGNGSAFDALGGMAPHPQAVVASMNVTTGLAIAVRARMPSSTDADAIVASFGGQLDGVRPMVSKVDVRADGADVKLTLEATGEQIEAMTAMIGPMLGGM